MDDEHSVIIVQYEHDLQEPTTSAPAPHKPFVVFTPQWIGSCGLLHDLLRFLNTHAMGLDVIDVPSVPTKVQEPSITYITN
jgi:hypothetical protein